MAVVIGLALAAALLFLEEEEEEEEEPGEFGSFRPSTDEELTRLPELAQALLVEVEGRIARISAAAARHVRRHRVLVLSGAAFAGAVPVTAAANGPTWLMAALGAAASFLVVVLQVTQDHEIGTEQHLLAVQMSRAIRRFRIAQGFGSSIPLEASLQSLMSELDDMEVA